MDLRLSMRSLQSLTKDDVCPTYTFKILVRYLAKFYVDIPQTETIRHTGQFAMWILGKP